MATKKTRASSKKTATKKAKAEKPVFVPLATHLPELPDIPSRALAGLAAKVAKAKDVYRKRDAIEGLCSYAERAALYGALLRHGVVPLWDEPDLWSEMAERRQGDSAAITPKDVALLLSKIERYERPKSSEITRVLPSWPKALDDLTLPAYLEDPTAFADFEAWAKPVKKGFLTVLVRAGARPREALGPGFVKELARLQLQSYGLPSNPSFVQDGEHYVYDEMYDEDQRPTKDFWDFVSLFTTKEEFLAALDEAASEPKFVENHNSALLHQQIDVLRRAPIDRLARHLSKTGLDDKSSVQIHALLAERRDTPAELFELARLLKANEKLKSEVAAVRGVLRAKERGERLPENVDELFTGGSVQTGYRPIEPVHGVTELVAALRILGQDRAKMIVSRWIESEYELSEAFPVLHAFAEDRDLLDRAFDRLAVHRWASREIFMGIALFPKESLDLLAEKHDLVLEKGGPARAELVRRGIQGVLAKLAQNGTTWEPRFDRFLDVHGFENDIDGKPSFNVDYDFHHYIAPVLRVATTGLSAERRRAWLDANLEPEKPGFARVLAAVPRDDEALIGAMFAALAPHHERVRMAYTDWLTELARELGERAFPHVRFLLEATRSQRFRKSLVDAFDEERLNAALAGSEAADVREETTLEKIARLSKGIEGPTEAITILEKIEDDEDDEDKPPRDVGTSRIGGPGFDLGERQPRFQDEPMTHMFTLATADVPHLKSVFPDAAAVAVYVANPDMNEAFESYNAETAVVPLSAEDIARGLAQPTPNDRRLAAVRATTVEVPSAIFLGQRGEKETELRDAIYRLRGRAGGEPIWLQSEEEGGQFLLQFDEGFVDVNLGDCGVMYVFDDTAFWQCY